MEQEIRSISQNGQPEPPLHMVPEALGKGPRVDHELRISGAKAIRWVSTETNSDGTPLFTRDPQERTEKYAAPGPFMAAGKNYDSLKQLHAVNSGDFMRYTDIYGRHVFYDAERFPCFDSYDYMYEKRCYRWFFILENGTLTRVYYTDTSDWIHVTEDVRNIEETRWEHMQEYHFFEWEV